MTLAPPTSPEGWPAGSKGEMHSFTEVKGQERQVSVSEVPSSSARWCSLPTFSCSSGAPASWPHPLEQPTPSPFLSGQEVSPTGDKLRTCLRNPASFPPEIKSNTFPAAGRPRGTSGHVGSCLTLGLFHSSRVMGNLRLSYFLALLGSCWSVPDM